jgi:phytanoyl-CoA hydroxylase
MLSESQAAQFHELGYVNGGAALGEEEVEILRAETMRVIENQHELEHKPVHIVNLSGKGEAPVWQIVNIWQASTAFRHLVGNSKIAQDIAQLSGANEVRLWHDQIQYKPAAVGGVNMWHQDSPLWPPLEPKTEQVTAWVALDDVDEENGCMWMVPESHKWGPQMQHIGQIRDFYAIASEFEEHALKTVACPVKKGHVHYHHSLTWHGSGPNTSGRPRRAIALHYMNERTVYTKRGAHPMNPFIHVAEGEMLAGDAFPLVWPQP